MKREIQLPYGTDTLKFRVPEVNLVGVYSPQPVAACADQAAEVGHALTHPLDTPPLSEMVRPQEKVVILVDDHTRATPAAQILPPLLDELRAGGVRDEDVTILITHGTHRLSTDEEVRRKVGEDAYGRFRIEQHQCTDEESQVYLGLTSRGTPVWVNRLVVEADRCIGIGHIGPSPYAGYSGGGKLILPGAAALDTINANHSLVPLGFRQPGWVDLPCRLDIEEAAALVKLDMIVNVVLSQDERIVRAFAGTPGRVFQEGLALARQVYEVACPRGIDIAITSGYPYEFDLYQAVRAVEYADVVVREGGSILLVAACPEGVGGEDFYHLMADQTKRPDDFLRDVVRRNGMVTFSVLGYALARIKAEKRLHIMTEGISEVELEAMGFHYLRDLTGFGKPVRSGVDALLREYGPQARVAVFPMGASTIPVVV
ncbi:MAG: nickel-dependent lactate racemase [Chloroflexi bacterium]|nr:nickel-dependent lactate racemase [Chloroflexota bacterium]